MSEIGKALLKVQGEAPSIQKEGTNPHFKSKYVTLDTLLGEILPILNKHNVVLIQSPTTLDGTHLPALQTQLFHAESGEFYEATMPLVLPAETPQGQGSALTYARRYALMAMLGLATEDDDGQAASEKRANHKPAATEAEHTPGQLQELTELLAALENNHPHPAQDWNWTKEAQKFCKDHFDKTSTVSLTKAEMQQLIEEMELALKAAGEHAEIPFG